MHRILLWTAFIRLYGFIGGEKGDENCSDLDKLLLTTTETLTKLVEPISSRLGNVSGRLDRISKKIEIQKSTIESLKSAHNPWNGEVEELLKAVENVSFNQLQSQKSIREWLKSQEARVREIKNIIAAGFSKVYEKLQILSEVNIFLLEIPKELENLAMQYKQQEKKLANLHDTMKKTLESIDNAIANNIEKMETMHKDILRILDEQRRPLSKEALSHVNMLATIARSMFTEMERLNDLEPKLLHLFRLSEDLQKEIPRNDLIRNMAVSLRSLKDLVLSIISSVYKDMKEVGDALQQLKTMSKGNNCPADLTSELYDHHNEIIKYLNHTIEGEKNKEDSKEIWNKLMRKLENIKRDFKTNSNSEEKLIKLREDVSDIREWLRDHIEETEHDDNVFG